jgi:hypothetical protein
MLGWVARVAVPLARRVARELSLLVNRPRRRAVLLAGLIAALLTLAWLEAQGLGAPPGPGGKGPAIPIVFAVVAVLWAGVQSWATVLEENAARNAELERYCRTYATSRALVKAAEAYRTQIEREELGRIDEARSRIPTLVQP